MKKIRLDLAYDGADFFGWQKQRSAEMPTVQGHLEKALARIFDQPVKTLGAGRTDARVHALHQVAHFMVPKETQRLKLVRGLNSLTPPSIVVKKAFVAPDDFHALASSSGKIYKYLILNRPLPSALRARYTTWEERPLDLDFLQEASNLLIGQHDFKSFQTTGTDVKSTLRQVRSIQWAWEGDILAFTIEGEGFLKQMVRNIVGTLLDLYFAGQPTGEIKKILGARDRQAAGTTAPPQGLYLTQVLYPGDLDRKCREI